MELPAAQQEGSHSAYTCVMTAAVYHHRANVLEGAAEYRVEPEALVVSGGGRPERRLPWSAVRRVRLSFAPTRLKPRRYVLALRFASGEKLQLDNMHWAGMADFKDFSESYRAFVLAAVERIVALAPEARGHAGEPVWGYLLQIAAFTAPASFLIWLLIEIRSKGGPNHADLVVPLLFSLPLVGAWLLHARPRPLNLRALPPSVLP
jgi:hypothetical protein